MSAREWPVVVDRTWGCWVWQGHVDKRDGYGLIWRGRTPVRAHGVVYASEVGPVPDGKVLGHRCLNRRCVRPGHIQPTSHADNLRFRTWSTRVRADLCEKKHDASSAMVTPWGGRLCRICDR